MNKIPAFLRILYIYTLNKPIPSSAGLPDVGEWVDRYLSESNENIIQNVSYIIRWNAIRSYSCYANSIKL